MEVFLTMFTDPRNVQGSDADRAEAGLDPEAEFAELDGPTAHRLAAEARSQGAGSPARAAGNEGQGAYPGQGGRITGTPAVDMLTSPVEGGLQDAANVDEQFLYDGPQI